jgi:formylmethanofuran dehydrogenase subunit B
MASVRIESKMKINAVMQQILRFKSYRCCQQQPARTFVVVSVRKSKQSQKRECFFKVKQNNTKTIYHALAEIVIPIRLIRNVVTCRSHIFIVFNLEKRLTLCSKIILK